MNEQNREQLSALIDDELSSNELRQVLSQLSSDDERVLFEQFRAYKAQQELERALQN